MESNTTSNINKNLNHKLNISPSKNSNISFVAIDFETATKNYNSACSIGLVEFSKDGVLNKYNVTSEHYFLIQPPNNEYNQDNINIHKITPSDTKASPTFDVVWQQIKHFFNGDYIVIAQNANFDMSVLKACLQHYHLETYLPFTYWDSISIATYIVPHDVKKGLASLTAYFELSLSQHHNALCDAKACAEICIICFEKMNTDSYYVKKDGTFKHYILKKLNTDFLKLELKQKININRRKTQQPRNNTFSKYQTVKPTDFTPNTDADMSNIFYSKNVVVTGDIKGFSRDELFTYISKQGGIVKGSVTKTTDILIIGTQDLNLVGHGGVSNKEKKVRALIDSGMSIEILDETSFLGIANKQ